MVESIAAFGRDHIQRSRKRVFFTRKECDAITKHLLKQDAAKSSSSRDPNGAARGGVPDTTISEEVLATLKLVYGSNGPVLVRRVADRKKPKSAPDKTVLRRVVPLEDLDEVFQQRDQCLGHPGSEVLFADLAKKVTTQLGFDAKGRPVCIEGLAGFHRDAVDFYHFKLCPTCAATKSTKPAKKPASQAIITRGPFHLCQLDLIDLGSHGHRKYRYVLNYTDRFTKHVWLRPLKNKTSQEVARQLIKIWADTRAPLRLHTDNGLEFGGFVKRLCREWGVKQVKGRPYRPQTQGGVERMGQTVKAKLRAAFLQFSDADWPTELLRIQKQINNCPTRVLDDMTPHEALYGEPDPMPMQPESGSYKELLGDPNSDSECDYESVDLEGTDSEEDEGGADSAVSPLQPESPPPSPDRAPRQRQAQPQQARRASRGRNGQQQAPVQLQAEDGAGQAAAAARGASRRSRSNQRTTQQAGEAAGQAAAVAQGASLRGRSSQRTTQQAQQAGEAAGQAAAAAAAAAPRRAQRRSRRPSLAVELGWMFCAGMVVPRLEDLDRGTPVAVVSDKGEVASGEVISTDPMETLPGTSSLGLAAPTIGDGCVLLKLQWVRPTAATVPLEDPCHPTRSNLGEYSSDDMVVLPIEWLRVDPFDSAAADTVVPSMAAADLNARHNRPRRAGSRQQQATEVPAEVPAPPGRPQRAGSRQQQAAAVPAKVSAPPGRPQHAGSRQQQAAAVPAEVPVPARCKRAAAEGVEMLLQAMHGVEVAMPSPLKRPRRAAAAGVQQAAAAAAADSSISSEEGSGEGQGCTLSDLAAAAEAASPPPPALPKQPELAAVRQRVLAAQARNSQRIEGQRRQRGEDKDFQPGDLVYLSLPAAVRGPLDPLKLVCRVLDIDNRGLHLLRCNLGILDHRYPADDLRTAHPSEAVKLNFEGLGRRNVPKVTIKAAAQAQHVGGAGARCACRKGCGIGCRCRQRGVLCSRECGCACGKGGSCQNYH